MESASSAFRRSLRPLLGNVIGVGIFALPYAVAQSGFGVGIVALLLCGAASLVAYLLYAEIALHTSGHARYVGLVRQYLGPFGGFLASSAFFIAVIGTLTAYVLVGGSFAHVLFAPMVGGSLLVYRVLFLAVSSVAILGGLMSVMRVQKYVIGAYLFLILLMVVCALPHIEVRHFLGADVAKAYLPFGVALFAFNGFSAVPEMRDVLGRHKHLLPRAVCAGLGIVACVYFVFTAIVLGVSGTATSQEALYGLAQVSGPAMLVIGTAIGMCTVGTAFMTHGLVMTNTLVYDYRVRYLVAWAMTMMVPLCLLLIGSSDFVRIITLTGGVGGGLSGLVLIAAYEKMRIHPQTPKSLLAIPQWAVFLSGLVFLFVMIATVLDS